MSAADTEGAAEQAQVEQDIADLHGLGYRQSLRRTIGLFTSFALGFAMVSITAAVFTTFSTGFVNVGGASIWLWIPVMIGVLAIAAVYGHLSARLPLTGYAYQWSARIVNGHWGWFTGWSALLAFTAGTAGLSIAMGTVFAPYVWHNPTHGQIQLFGIVMIAIGTALNAIGVRAATWVNNIGAGVELLGTVGLALVMAIGLFFFDHKAGPAILTQVHAASGSPVTFTAVMLAVLLPVYTLIGWEGSADLAEETRDPRRVAPKAMIRAIVISTVAGFFVFAIFSMAIPTGVDKALNAGESPIIFMFRYHFGSFLADLMIVIAFIAFLSALIANVAVCTRLIFSLSRDKMLPGWQVFSKVNTKTRTPLYVIFLVAAISVLLNLLSAGIVTRIVSIVAVTYYLTYVLTMGGAIYASTKGRIPKIPAGSGYFDLGRWLIPMAVFAIAFALFIMAYLSVPVVNRTAGEYSIYAFVVGFIWWAVYLAWKIRRGEAGPPTEAMELPESGDEHLIAKESAEDVLGGMRS
jgi:amino acid transporter